MVRLTYTKGAGYIRRLKKTKSYKTAKKNITKKVSSKYKEWSTAKAQPVQPITRSELKPRGIISNSMGFVSMWGNVDVLKDSNHYGDSDLFEGSEISTDGVIGRRRRGRRS